MLQTKMIVFIPHWIICLQFVHTLDQNAWMRRNINSKANHPKWGYQSISTCLDVSVYYLSHLPPILHLSNFNL
jgi:hypothetical protein